MKYLFLILFSLSVFADVPSASALRDKSKAIKDAQLSKASAEANDAVDKAIVQRSDLGFFNAEITIDSICNEAKSFGISSRLEAKGYVVSFTGRYDYSSCAIRVEW